MTKQFICGFFALLMLVSVCLFGCASSNQTLTTEVENEICQSYWDTYVRKSESITVADLRVECVYQSDEIYAIFIHDPTLAYITMERLESVGDVTLIFEDGKPLYIFNQGKLSTLKAAFESELIGTNYLKNLKTALNKYYTNKYR